MLSHTRLMTTDRGIHAQISDLVAQERQLRAKLQEHEMEPEEERARLQDLEVQLDQCWDLLRQRQALRDAGGDPAVASVRSANEVEGYLG
jgi:peptidoglycan hydrolase CwlO-like protein